MAKNNKKQIKRSTQPNNRKKQVNHSQPKNINHKNITKSQPQPKKIHKKKTNRLIDFILLCIFVVSIIYSMYRVSQFPAFPIPWIFGFYVVMLLIFIIYYKLSLKPFKSWFRFILRFIFLGICIIVLTISNLLYQVKSSLDKISIGQTTSNTSLTTDVFTVYCSGIDAMGKPDQNLRSDTNLLLIVNPKDHHITMISIPRDAYMPNPALENKQDKFTHTSLYGIENSVNALENCLNIPIDYYARISFQSLISTVDILGGVNVDVEIDFCEQDENRSFKKENLICLKKGEQELNGRQALAYARHRKTAGYDNAGRERAQQRIIKAMVKKVASFSSILQMEELLNQLDKILLTNISSSQISSFISQELTSLNEWTFSSIACTQGVYDDQYCASNDEKLGTSDVYLFDPYDIYAIRQLYDGAKNQPSLSDYTFNLDYLEEGVNDYTNDYNMVWDQFANNPH